MRLEYEDFYKIAKCLNEINNNICTEQEIACSAYDYKLDYDYSIKHGFSTLIMRTLCKELVYDMDYEDYEEYTQELLDIETMNCILENFLNDKC